MDRTPDRDAGDVDRLPPGGPVDGDRIPYYEEVPTFLRLPVRRRGDGADVAILGIPYDSGVTERAGTREGPRAVRLGSSISRPVHGKLGAPYEGSTVVDAGDVPANPLDPEGSRAEIEHRYRALRLAGPRVIAVGGDHSASLHCLAAGAWEHPLALIQFDAHSDTSDIDSGSRFNHATVFRRAVERGLIDPTHSIQVGIRPDVHGGGDLAWAREAGFAVVDIDEIMAEGLDAAAARILSQVGGADAYLTVDIDVLDPGFAPGTGSPEPGGLATRELRYLLARLSGVRLVGADLMEVAPCYDVGNLTALVAGRILFDLVALMV